LEKKMLISGRLATTKPQGKRRYRNERKSKRYLKKRNMRETNKRGEGGEKHPGTIQ